MGNPLFSDLGVRYEVAIGILETVMSGHAAAIGARRIKDASDDAFIEAELEKIRDLDALCLNLNHKSEEDIERVIAEYGSKARQLCQA